MDSEHKYIRENTSIRDRWSLAAKFLLPCVFLVALYLVTVPFMGDARPAAYKNQCRNNARAIAIAINEYIETNKDFPRDDNGKFTIHAVKKLKPGLILKCPAGHSVHEIDYDVNEKLTLEDLKRRGYSRTILVAERNFNHTSNRRIVATADAAIHELWGDDIQLTPDFPWDFQIRVD